VLQLGLDLLRTEDAHLRALLRAALGEDQLAAVLQPQPEGRCLRPLRAGLEETDAAGAHQMDVEDELTVVGGEEEVLAAAARAREAPALERRERRVERLQRRHVRRPCLGDRRARERLVEHPPCRLYLRKLGNSSSSWTRSM
jgi:hypothetical protein